MKAPRIIYPLVSPEGLLTAIIGKKPIYTKPLKPGHDHQKSEENEEKWRQIHSIFV